MAGVMRTSSPFSGYPSPSLSNSYVTRSCGWIGDFRSNTVARYRYLLSCVMYVAASVGPRFPGSHTLNGMLVAPAYSPRVILPSMMWGTKRPNERFGAATAEPVGLEGAIGGAVASSLHATVDRVAAVPTTAAARRPNWERSRDSIGISSRCRIRRWC